MGDEIKWITVNHVHIPIKPGQHKDDVVNAFLEKEKEKQNFKDMSIDELKKYLSSNVSDDEKEKLKYRYFETRADIDSFFLFDDEKRGLLAKRNSSHGIWEHSLTPHQRYVMDDYAADGYSNINSYLRGYDNGQSYSVDFIKGQIKALDKAIADYTLKEPIITYRAINSEAVIPLDCNINALIGTEYTDKAFMSTTPYLNSPALNKDLIMKIKLPAGKGIGAYIEQYNGLGEAEFLLARNSKFIITNVKKENKHFDMEMELVR